jgi:hypothetical protein
MLPGGGVGDAGRDRHGGVHIDKAIDPASGERLFLGRAGRETSGRGPRQR